MITIAGKLPKLATRRRSDSLYDFPEWPKALQKIMSLQIKTKNSSLGAHIPMMAAIATTLLTDVTQAPAFFFFCLGKVNKRLSNMRCKQFAHLSKCHLGRSYTLKMFYLFQRAGQTERLRVDSYHLLLCRLCFRVLPGDYSFCQKSAIYFFFFLVVDGFFGAGLPLIFAD